VTIEEKDGITVVATEEKLDAVVATKLKDAVKKLAEDGQLKILIDMGKTRFIDSAGCGALVASLRVLLKNKGDMKIARPSAQVQTLFELTRLHKVFEIFDDIEAAIQSFA
jgi:anti-sigma B factor antagonist